MIDVAYDQAKDCVMCARHRQGTHPARVMFEVSSGVFASCSDCLDTRTLTHFKGGFETQKKPEKAALLTTSPARPALSPSEKQVGGSHYKSFVIQPWHFCMVNGLDFATSSVIKYVCRKKGDKAKQIEDLRKAIHNIEMKIEMLEKGPAVGHE